VETFHLDKFTIVTGEKFSDELAAYGLFEAALTEAFLNLIQPGQVVLDVGMHLGYYTTLFAALVGSQGEVHAFEPTPSTREIASHNASLFSQVTMHPYAVWSSEGVQEFRDYGLKWMAFNSFMNARTTDAVPEPKVYQVETISLDHFRDRVAKKIDLIKIDAESAEREILLGARNLMNKDHPIITLEVGDRGGGGPVSRDLIDYMANAEYLVWEFSGGRFARHIPRDVYDYDNLIFAHRSYDLDAGSPAKLCQGG
jgi:FkbM family methyltransferase